MSAGSSRLPGGFLSSLILLARSRRTGSGLLMVAGVVATLPLLGGITVQTGLDRPVTLPLALLIPAALAAIIAVSAESRLRPYDDLATHRVVWLRLGHLAGLTMPTIVGVLLATPDLGGGHGPWSAARNFAGLLGLTLLAAVLVGAALSWAPAAALLGAQLLVGTDPSAAVLWSWLVAPDAAPGAAVTASMLMTVGGVSFCLLGDGGGVPGNIRSSWRAIVAAPRDVLWRGPTDG